LYGVGDELLPGSMAGDDSAVTTVSADEAPCGAGCEAELTIEFSDCTPSDRLDCDTDDRELRELVPLLRLRDPLPPPLDRSAFK